GHIYLDARLGIRTQQHAGEHTYPIKWIFPQSLTIPISRTEDENNERFAVSHGNWMWKSTSETNAEFVSARRVSTSLTSKRLVGRHVIRRSAESPSVWSDFFANRIVHFAISLLHQMHHFVPRQNCWSGQSCVRCGPVKRQCAT